MNGESTPHEQIEINPPIQPTDIFSLEQVISRTDDLTKIVAKIREEMSKTN